MSRIIENRARAALVAGLFGLFLGGSALAQEPMPAPEPAPAQEATPVGHWSGVLTVPGAELRLILHVSEGEGGTLTATLDSPDQGAFGIPASAASFADGTLSVHFNQIQGVYEGTLGESGGALDGTWSQGGQSLDLDLARQEDDGSDG